MIKILVDLYVDPPQCMPEECKGEDTVLAYQTYYIIEKAKIATWNKQEQYLHGGRMF